MSAHIECVEMKKMYVKVCKKWMYYFRFIFECKMKMWIA